MGETTWTDPKTGAEVRVGDRWLDKKPIYVGYPLRSIVILAIYSTGWVQIKTLAYQFAAGGWIKEHTAKRRPQSILKRFTLVERAPVADPNALKPCPPIAMTLRQAQDVFARYLLDRADQYDTDSGCWIALSDAAQEVANGEAWSDFEHGELDGEALKRRVQSMARTAGARPLNPKLGTDE